jgi:16S rRNA (cytosine1402-N4)-methyltransferase
MALHEPVMTREVLAVLRPERGGVYVDCTVGLGGHARAMLEAGAGRVIGLDRDLAALALAAEALGAYRDRVELVHSDYREIDAVLEARGIARVDGALTDMGMSSYQLSAEGRGFSFQREDPLDMRMDVTSGPTAADLLRSAKEEDIADAIYRFGEERFSRRIARAIVTARAASRIESTGQLADLVRRAVPRRGFMRIDPATRTFQALRIWVNRELEHVDDFLRAAARRLNIGARLVTITFHSLEDRIVKHTLRALEHGEHLTCRVLTRKPITPGAGEIASNPRARSAKLRAAECIAWA